MLAEAVTMIKYIVLNSPITNKIHKEGKTQDSKFKIYKVLKIKSVWRGLLRNAVFQIGHGRLPMLQWVSPNPRTHSQHQLDPGGYYKHRHKVGRGICCVGGR